MPHLKMSVAVGLIQNDDGKILLGKRETGYYNGYWEFPGGKIEDGESSRQALERELEEELGIIVTDASEIMTIQHTLHISTLILYIYQVHSFENNLIPNEQQQLQWVNVPDIRKLHTIPTNDAIIQFLEQSYASSISQPEL